MEPNFFSYAEQHLFAAKQLIEGLLAEAPSPYMVDTSKKALLIRPIGLLLGLTVELMLKGAIALDEPVAQTHSFSKLMEKRGGKRLVGLLTYHAKHEARATLIDPDLNEASKVTVEEAADLLLEFIICIGKLHIEGGNLYRYGGEGRETPHPVFLMRVLWRACLDLRENPAKALEQF